MLKTCEVMGGMKLLRKFFSYLGRTFAAIPNQLMSFTS